MKQENEMKYLEGLRAQAKVAKSKFEATRVFSQNVTKGEVREHVLANYLRPFLPSLYGLGTGQVFSSQGDVSRQIDIVIYDAVFSIVMRIDEKQLLLPCESVYGNIEVKSFLGRKELDTAIETGRKPGSERALQRLSEALRADMEELVAHPAG